MILKEIKPTIEERKKVLDYSDKLIDIIEEKAEKEDLDIKCRLVGSMAKKTSLMDKADMDLFITFPLTYSEEELKEYGMKLGRYCIEKIGAKEEVRYASHPYITGLTDDFEIDFVPCYQIRNAEELKSAVDRTILHTDYIQKHLNDSKSEQVLLLKKFMTSVGTYGANAKVNGFSGYLCELLILRYHSFDEVINAAANIWHERYYIDLEDYGTAKNFDSPLIVIDPTDKTRNVSAALSMQKLSEFIAASRNYQKNPSIEYFHERKIKTTKKEIRNEFTNRKTKTYILSFNVPELPSDTIYPQVEKSAKSIVKVSENYDFRILESKFYITDDNIARIILEYDVDTLSNMKIHEGPLIKYVKNGDEFKIKYKQACVKNNRWIAYAERKYKNVPEMIRDILLEDNIRILKIGKNIKKEILTNYSFEMLDKHLENANSTDLKALYLHLHPEYNYER